CDIPNSLGFGTSCADAGDVYPAQELKFV
ncbi:hypothetical protein A2U01_0038611, partial [Trifolium medium]|nr:hypothetical protein [Trifolium medium]